MPPMMHRAERRANAAFSLAIHIVVSLLAAAAAATMALY